MMKRFAYTLTATPDAEGPIVTALEPSAEVAAICRKVAPDDGREHLVAFALDARGQIQGYQVVTSGTVDACMLYPRDVFAWAVQVPLVRYVGLAHNHPAGIVTPSGPDVKGTAMIGAAGQLMGLDVAWAMVFTHRSEDWAKIEAPKIRQPKGGEDGEAAPAGMGGEPEEPEEAPEGEPAGEKEAPGDDADGPVDDAPGGVEGEPAAEGLRGATGADIDDVRRAMGRLVKRRG
jgi:DNA repair protein RadC